MYTQSCAPSVKASLGWPGAQLRYVALEPSDHTYVPSIDRSCRPIHMPRLLRLAATANARTAALSAADAIVARSPPLARHALCAAVHESQEDVPSSVKDVDEGAGEGAGGEGGGEGAGGGGEAPAEPWPHA